MSNGETRLIIPRANPIAPSTRGSIACDAGLIPDKFRRLAKLKLLLGIESRLRSGGGVVCGVGPFP